MAAKTTQALKITASWTPSAAIADKIMAAAFVETPAKGAKIAGGRVSIKHAIKIDFSDPAQATRVSDRVAQIKEALAAVGELHGFTTTAGAVPVDDAEVLPEPDAEPAGAATGDGTGEAAPPADDTEKQGKARRKATPAEAAA